MTREFASSPMRVEKVLRLLPEVDAMAPLRTLLVSTSRTEGAAEPHLTVGKRIVQSSDLIDLVPRALQRVSVSRLSLHDGQTLVPFGECVRIPRERRNLMARGQQR